VANREQLQGQLVSFAFCPLSKRQFAVLRGSLHQQQQGSSAVTAEEQQQHVNPQGQGGTEQSAFKVGMTGGMALVAIANPQCALALHTRVMIRTASSFCCWPGLILWDL
jgi:hypothetical protein